MMLRTFDISLITCSVPTFDKIACFKYDWLPERNLGFMSPLFDINMMVLWDPDVPPNYFTMYSTISLDPFKSITPDQVTLRNDEATFAYVTYHNE